MLSILIPNYNYNVFPLVKALVLQCEKVTEFEVVVFDDTSTKVYNENADINTLPNCVYKVLPNNIGRSAIRNLLVKQAKYNWILFLDSDVMPVLNDFILNYVTCINKNAEVCFGGLAYQANKPEKKAELRWFYGTKREALSVNDRIKTKPNDFFCSNLLIKKNVFNSVLFNESIRKYGYEDLIFNKNIIEKGFKIKQLSNAVYHLNIEDNLVFIEKTELALQNLKFLNDAGFLNGSDIKILSFAKKLDFFFIKKGIVILNMTDFIKKRLLQFPDKIWLFDTYKLLYFLKL